MLIDNTDKKLLEEVQKDFPIHDSPYKIIGNNCGITESEVISRLNSLVEKKVIREFSTILVPQKLGFKTTLVATKIDEIDFEQTVSKLNSHPGISHNYLRNHDYNVWFTLSIAKNKSFKKEIHKTIGIKNKLLILPAKKIFKLGVFFSFSMSQNLYVHSYKYTATTEIELLKNEKLVINVLQNNIPIINNPWQKITSITNLTKDELFEIINTLKQKGVIKRISAVLKHRNVGFQYNGMACFNITGDIVKAGQAISRIPQVSHCYERESNEYWPYQLYAMIHSTEKENCIKIAKKISEMTACKCYKILFSIKELKKQRVKYYY